MPIDAIGEHRTGRRLQAHALGSCLGAARRTEGAFFQALRHQSAAGFVPVEDFEPRAPLVGEGEDRSAFHIGLEFFTHSGVKALKALAHVDGVDFAT